MSPKKAIIIVFILFLIMVVVFVFLYINNKSTVNQTIEPPADNSGNNTTSAGLADQAELLPIQQKIEAIEAKINQQVEQIVEQGKTSGGGLTVEAQRKIEQAVNQGIMEKAKLKTPEQLKADAQRQAELDKMEQEVNQRIKSQLQTQ